jgi:hypothetical protein
MPINFALSSAKYESLDQRIIRIKKKFVPAGYVSVTGNLRDDSGIGAKVDFLDGPA